VTKFIDVSNNNGHVDFVAAKRAGAIGVYLKVTEGTDFVDRTYLANRAAAKRAGLLVGGYHFAHPADNPHAEAAFFLSHLKYEPGDLIPMLDLERSAAPKPEGVVKPYAQAFIAAVKKAHGHCGLYCGSFFIKAHGLADLGVPRWIPSYGAKPKFYSYAAWQLSNGDPKYPGAILHLDTSVVVDMRALRGTPAPKPSPTPPPPPKPTPKPRPKRRYITYWGMRVRVGSRLYKWIRRLLKTGRLKAS
jgi:hypothetical protein